MDNGSVHIHQNPSYPSHFSIPHTSQLPVASGHQPDLLAHLDRLKFFLATAPSRWSAHDATPDSHPALNRFLLPSGEYVTCVLWSGLYHITGTDIVRALVFRFEAFGRPVRNMKKFEEGVFSDLRNLKPGHDACLEEPKSPFLDLLFKYQCIRTQKKQKVFYWFSVPHDRLFLDALERDLKREKMGLESTTTVVAEPALSFSYDPKRPLFEQFTTSAIPHPNLADSEPEDGIPRAACHGEPTVNAGASSVSLPDLDYPSARSSLESPKSSLDGASIHTEPPTPPRAPQNPLARSPFFSMFALFEGSPTYKQRRKKSAKSRRSVGDEDGDGRKHILDTGRRSLDSVKPSIRSQPRSHDACLMGPGQVGPTNGLAYSTPSHVGGHSQQMHIPPVTPSLSRPATQVCPLFTCRQVFSDTESLQNHMRTHENDRRPADSQRCDMDVDRRESEDTGAYPNAQFVRDAQHSQYSRGSPEMTQIPPVLTSSDGSPSYDDCEDEQVYGTNSQWVHHGSESSTYSSVSGPVPSSGYIHNYTCDSSSVGSGSSPEAHSAPPAPAPAQSYHSPDPPYSFSAPSHRANFVASYSSSISPTDSYPTRRPRSVTPPLSHRVPHARRPSTANEIPSNFGASPSVDNGSSWHQRPAPYAPPRGYHPYAIPMQDRSYGTNSTHSSPGSSPFAVSLNTSVGEYSSDASSHTGEYTSESESQTHYHEYAPPSEPPSPHLQSQFTHMVGLEGASPVENVGFRYTHEEAYDESEPVPSHCSYANSAERTTEPPQSGYQYTQDTAEYPSDPVPPADGAVYQFDQIVPAHNMQMHPQYYESQVAS